MSEIKIDRPDSSFWGWFKLIGWLLVLFGSMISYLCFTDAWEKKDMNFFFTAFAFAMTMISGSGYLKWLVRPARFKSRDIDIFAVIGTALAVSYFIVYKLEGLEPNKMHVNVEVTIFVVAMLFYLVEIIVNALKAAQTRKAVSAEQTSAEIEEDKQS